MPLLSRLVGKLLYYPERLAPDAPLPPWAADATEVRFSTADGVRLHGLWWPGPPGGPLVLFLHGNAQEVFSWAQVRQEIAPEATGMLLFDYRGYGKSEGAVLSEQGLYRDGRAALRWLSEEQGVPLSRIVLFGKSLGGGVAVEIGRRQKLAGIILESTFTSVAAVARSLFPFDVSFLLTTERYDSLSKIGELCCPLLLIHGTDDELIPVEQGRQLYEAAPSPKQLYLVSGAGHNDVSLTAPQQYARVIGEFLASLAPATVE